MPRLQSQILWGDTKSRKPLSHFLFSKGLGVVYRKPSLPVKACTETCC